MKKHGLMMLLCCLIPIILVPIVLISGRSVSSLIFLLCPILHIGMMMGMRKSGKGGHSCHSSNDAVKVEESNSGN